MMNDLKVINDENYQQWICDIKELVHVSQLKAAVQVNTEMIRMYWHIGKEISEKHADAIWGTGFYKIMSSSLKNALLNSIKAVLKVVNKLLTIWKRFILYHGDIIF